MHDLETLKRLNDEAAKKQIRKLACDVPAEVLRRSAEVLRRLGVLPMFPDKKTEKGEVNES